MHKRFYTTSASAWKAMLRAIRHARASVYLETYIFEEDTEGFDFITALQQKAREGVRVIVILDAFGSARLPEDIIAQLRNAGAEVLFYSFWFRRLHRKHLIVDEHTAFVGGVNISPRFKNWNDLHVRLTGAVVSAIVRSFSRVYRECGGSSEELRSVRDKSTLHKARIWFIEHGMSGKHKEFHREYVQHIAQATRSIVLVTPYFLPAPWLREILNTALERGVDLTIIVPEKPDYAVAERLNYHYASMFARRGARILFFPGMNHAKILMIDDRTASVGSQNIDALSFEWNIEAGVFFDSPAMITELQKIIRDWEMRSVPLEQYDDKRKWYDALIAIVLRLFRPVL